MSSTLWVYHPGDTALHRTPARAKVVALIVFATIVVSTPREWVPVFGVYAATVIAMLAFARIPARVVLARMLIEVPFVIFALLMPLIATGPRVSVAQLSLSIDGLWGSWGLLAKATIALLASILLVTTTEPRRIVLALESLRLPRQLTAIMAFMLRYLELIVDELRRMHTARQARGFVLRGPRAWGMIATSFSSVFARSHARGERVHLAMLARGYGNGAR